MSSCELSLITMQCDDDEQYSNSIVQRKNSKQEQSRHGPLQKLGAGSGAIEE